VFLPVVRSLPLKLLEPAQRFDLDQTHAYFASVFYQRLGETWQIVPRYQPVLAGAHLQR